MNTRQQRRHRMRIGQRRIQQQARIPATIGRLESDGSYTVYQSKPGNILYARIVDETNRLVQAYNLKVKPRPKLDVWLVETLDGYEVDGVRAKRASEVLAEAAASFNTPDVLGEFMNTIVPERNYRPGLVRPATTTNLVVQVEPFWYRYFGTWTRWPGGTIDLASYLPATSTYWHWALVCVWPYGNQLVVVTTDETVNLETLTDSTLDDLAADIEGLVPCDAVKLCSDFTTFASADYFQHGRLNAADIDLPANPILMSSLYHHLPANRRAVWYGPLTVTGDFVIEGELTIL